MSHEIQQESPWSLLEQARGSYVDNLDIFRHQLHFRHSAPNDYERLDQSTRAYQAAYWQHLSTAPAEGWFDSQTPGQITMQEIKNRRDAIAARFREDPLRLHADTELLIGGSALAGVATNAFAGRIPSTIGSGLLAATSYYSFTYRRAHSLIDGSIHDSQLLENALGSLLTDDTITPEQCGVIFDATIDSEKASVTRMAAQLLRARTYTPLGFMRLAIYNFHRKRRSQKRAAAS